RGLAYVSWGPMWRRRGAAPDPEALRRIVGALRREFAVRRGMYLRIAPNACDDDAAGRAVLEGEGLACREPGRRTIVMDLAPEPAAIRGNLGKRWRQSLERAEASGLEVRCGDGDELFAQFLGLYGEMRARKGFVDFADVDEFRAL